MIHPIPVFIADARRSPIGRFRGALKSLDAADVALQVAQAIIPEELKPHVDQVILGQVLAAGSGMNVARQLGLRLGLPQRSPGFTLNMACASGLKAVALAAEAVASGESSLALAGGTESMSRAPHYAREMRGGRKLGDSVLVDSIHADALTDPVLQVAMGETAERLAIDYNITREEQDAFALASQQRAAASREAFRRELVTMETREGRLVSDEHPRPDTTIQTLATLKPAFRENGTVTPGNASGMNDGAALLLVGSERAIRDHSLKPRARIVASAAVGCDPSAMGLGPIHAIESLCARTGWELDKVGAIEINEAFAVQTLACARGLRLDREKLNRRGGAIALGHPLGCSGARVLVTLLHILEDHDLNRGIASLCVGGGMGIAMAIERDI